MERESARVSFSGVHLPGSGCDDQPGRAVLMYLLDPRGCTLLRDGHEVVEFALGLQEADRLSESVRLARSLLQPGRLFDADDLVLERTGGSCSRGTCLTRR